MRQKTRRKGHWARSAIAFGLTWVACWANAGDLGTEVNNMFNDLGTMGNYTAPGAFRGQTMNTYYGGSLYLRAPQKKYTAFHINAPTMTAGCGGIDAYLGSFTHISKDELKNMLQQITSALPGIAFQVALEVVSPLLGDITKFATHLNEIANRWSKGSCETAKWAAGNLAQQVGFSTDKACMSLRRTMVDEDRAELECKTPANKKSILDLGETSADPKEKALVPFVGNYIWYGLKQLGDIDDAERQLIMNITGTMIFYKTSDEKSPRGYEPRLQTLNALLNGDADGAAVDTVKMELWQCDDMDVCMNPFLKEVEFTPFTVLVKRHLETLLEAIKNRDALLNNTPAVGFVQRTTIPVWKMLSVGSAIPGSGLADTMIARYRDAIAADYAYSFMDRYVNGAAKAVVKNFTLTKDQEPLAKWVRDNPNQIKRQLALEMTRVETRTTAMAAIAGEIEAAQRQMRASMPSHVMDMLGYQATGFGH